MKREFIQNNPEMLLQCLPNPNPSKKYLLRDAEALVIPFNNGDGDSHLSPKMACSNRSNWCFNKSNLDDQLASLSCPSLSILNLLDVSPVEMRHLS